jgi:hypothetical protein
LNISYPANGSQKLIDIEDERKLRVFMEKRVRRTLPVHDFLVEPTRTLSTDDANNLFDRWVLRFPVTPSAMSSRATSSVSLVETTSRVSP